MKDNKCIVRQVSSVVDDGYKINVDACARFKVLSPHLTCIFQLGPLNLFKTVLIAVFLFSIVSFSYAETEITEGYDENTEMTIKGTVIEIMQGMRGPVILKLKTGAKIYSIVTAPQWYLSRNGINFTVGDVLEVTGSKYFRKDGNMYIISRRIKDFETGNVNILRDSYCKPLWGGGHRMHNRWMP
ncbi:hypothetical protein [Dissulfurispira thermophila]|nr:hypothetical protein [Dissulfurispira thermophila]